MAPRDQLQFQVKLTITESGKPLMESDTRNVILDMLGGEYSQRIQLIGSGGEEILNISPNIGVRGFYVLHNYDDTNYVEYGKTGELFNKLLPGEFCLIRSNLDSANFYAQADTAPCRIEVISFEN